MTNPVSMFIAISEGSVSDEEFGRALIAEAEKAKQTVGAFVDQLSILVAEAFVQGGVGYDIAGSLMDSVYRALLQPSLQAIQPIPALTLEVYEAFDRGEYLHPEHDLESEDPVEKYTLPNLRALVQHAAIERGLATRSKRNEA